jgi:hypothetical protein
MSNTPKQKLALALAVLAEFDSKVTDSDGGYNNDLGCPNCGDLGCVNAEFFDRLREALNS